MENVAILIPTLNAGLLWKTVLEIISGQSINISRKIIVDSGSTDDTVPLAIKYGFEVISIKKSEFNHGRTRQLLADKSGASIGVFMTQDAVLGSPDSIKNLIQAFDDDLVGVAYGRQLPREKATALETHARLFNYPEHSRIRSYADKTELGFKVFFCSNSFAAYRVSILKSVGGFPTESIMGEDALATAKMLSAGFKSAYAADAIVYHSHDYTVTDEFKRYFDTRVFHEQNDWLIREFGKPTGEGLRFVKSEILYVIKNDFKSFFKSLASLGAKWLGYQSGKYYKKMSPSFIKKLSMHRFYWDAKIN